MEKKLATMHSNLTKKFFHRYFVNSPNGKGGVEILTPKFYHVEKIEIELQ